MGPSNCGTSADTAGFLTSIRALSKVMVLAKTQHLVDDVRSLQDRGVSMPAAVLTPFRHLDQCCAGHPQPQDG